ncbi:unnamed protein product [Arabidopsis halleri]
MLVFIDKIIIYSTCGNLNKLLIVFLFIIYLSSILNFGYFKII